jgi:Glutamine amidotransferases class-II
MAQLRWLKTCLLYETLCERQSHLLMVARTTRRRASFGAVLDRNGLRPGRYYVTTDDLAIMASEAGVLTIPPEKVVAKGRLEPRKMFLVDTVAGRIVSDAEIKHEVTSAHPYRQWSSNVCWTMPTASTSIRQDSVAIEPVESEIGATVMIVRQTLQV